mgnify:CR=1 FL=1
MKHSVIYCKSCVLGHLKIASRYWGTKEMMPHHYGTRPNGQTQFPKYLNNEQELMFNETLSN